MQLQELQSDGLDEHSMVADPLFRDIDNCDFIAAVALAAAVPLLDFTGTVANMDIKNSHFFNNVDGGFMIISDQADNSGVVSYCNFGGADAAGANTAGVDLTGAHCFECYFSGDVDSWAILGGGGAIYNNA